MSCKIYTGTPRVLDQELRNKNDVYGGINNLTIPTKKIRYVIPIKI